MEKKIIDAIGPKQVAKTMLELRQMIVKLGAPKQGGRRSIG